MRYPEEVKEVREELKTYLVRVLSSKARGEAEVQIFPAACELFKFLF